MNYKYRHPKNIKHTLLVEPEGQTAPRMKRLSGKKCSQGKICVSVSPPPVEQWNPQVRRLIHKRFFGVSLCDQVSALVFALRLLLAFGPSVHCALPCRMAASAAVPAGGHCC